MEDKKNDDEIQDKEEKQEEPLEYTSTNKNSDNQENKNVENNVEVVEDVISIEDDELDDFILEAEKQKGEQKEEENITDSDAEPNLTVSQAQKILADTFVDLLSFVTDMLVGVTILKEVEAPDYEPFTDKEKKHLSKVWGNLICYYKLDNYFSPVLSASIVTITCLLGAVKRAKKYKNEHLQAKIKTKTVKDSNQLSLFDETQNNMPNNTPKKRGRPRKNQTV